VCSVFSNQLPSNTINNLKASLDITESIISEIHRKWAINAYPNFLSSASIPEKSWKIMKLKYINKAISSLLSQSSMKESNNQFVTFVMSFMGSSVTAGHDSPMNKSFTYLVGEIMNPAFEPVGVKIISRSGAVGNNPCMPYDLCPKAFSGKLNKIYDDMIFCKIVFSTLTNDNILKVLMRI